MILDWWFDAGDKVCQAAIKFPLFGSPQVSFPGEVKGAFKARRTLPHGWTLAYDLEGGEMTVNCVDRRGERFVSLYYRGALVKEYSYYYERYNDIYMDRADMYDEFRVFFWSFFWIDLITAGFGVSLYLAIFGLGLNLLGSVAGVLLSSLAVLVAVFCLVMAGEILVYNYLRRKMEYYGIISSREARRALRRRRKR